VPVSNLIKNSRGRRVPAPEEAGAEHRTFMCTVEGCGAWGAFEGVYIRMRNVSSLPPHPCPYEGCGKTFNRRDNLVEHARLH
ncbi:hypothetical protein FB45DRAFT_672433, partial [Roridomyces roridus]